MSGPEGWNGRSVRQHVEDVMSVARDASENADLARGGSRGARSVAQAASKAAERAEASVAALREEQDRLARAVAALEDRHAGNRAGDPDEARPA